MIGSKRRSWLLLGLLTIAVGGLSARLASAQPRVKTDWDRYMVAAQLAYGEEHYDEAEKQVKAALEYAKSFWSNDPRTAKSLELLGEIYRAQGKDADAEKPFKEALAIWKEVFPERPELVVPLDDLAQLYQDEGKYAEAEPLFKQGITVMEKAYGKESDIVAARLDKLAGLYCAAGKYEKAEPLYKRALEIRKNALGRDHLDVAQSLENYAKVRKLDRVAEAEDLEARAKSIRKNR